MITWFLTAKGTPPQESFRSNRQWIGRLSLLVSLLLPVAAGHAVELRSTSSSYSQQPTAKTVLSPHPPTPGNQQADAYQSDGGIRTVYETGEFLLENPPHAQGEILVRFKHDVPQDVLTAVHARLGARLVRRYNLVKNLERVKLPQGLSVPDAVKFYLQHPDVLYAEPDYIVNAHATPNDPYFDQLWGLHNTGQSGGTIDADIDAPEAWNITTGNQSVVVAVIDTGIDYNHEDLSANIWKNTADCNNNGIDDDGNGYIDDCYGIDTTNNDSDPIDDNGHGTHVAGTIGAVGNNDVGVVGVNWNVSIMACKFLDSNGSGYISDAIECLEYVKSMKERGVNIVATNNSYGGGLFSQALFDAIDAQRQDGILFIASAGNDWTNNDRVLQYPASYYLPNIISVAASTRTDILANFSNYGRRTVHLGAPGQDIISTFKDNQYAIADGTSFAAPHVSGVAALLKAQDPSRDWRAIKNLILSGGDSKSAFYPTITQKRLNAAGALSCSNSTVLSRLLPNQNSISWSVGAPLELALLHVNCAVPNGNLSVTVNPGNVIVTLNDAGLGFDQVAGDGIYSGQWTPSSGGTYTLAFPSGDIVFPGEDVVTVNIDPDLEPGFPVKAFTYAGGYHGGPAIHTLVGNIDADPSLEIVVTGLAGGPLYAWNSNGSLVSGWPLSDIFGAAYAGMGNLSNANPGNEIFAGHYSTQPKLAAYSGSGTRLPGWPRDSGFTATPPALADVDGDGLDEIFVEEEDWQLHAYRGDGSLLPGWPPVKEWLGGQERHTPAIADLDGDGKLEIVTASGPQSGAVNGWYLFAYHSDGTTVNGFPILIGSGAADTFPVIGDVDGDGLLEIIVGAGDGLLVFSANGVLKRTISSWCVSGAPALADLDGDGIPEILVQVNGALCAVHGDGSVPSGWPVTFPGAEAGNSAPVVGDVDGDGSPDIVITTVRPGYYNGSDVRVYNRFGVLHPHFPKIIPIGMGAVPAIADIDLDGRNEIIVTGDFWDGYTGYYDKVWVYDLGGPPHGPILWGQFMGGPKHQGRYDHVVNTFRLTVSNVGDGTVTSSPAGINCGIDCDERYLRGTSVTLTATPAIGSTFAGWSGGDCAGTTPCKLVMTRDIAVTATFDLLSTPMISLTPSSYNFGTVPIGTTVETNFTVQNIGGGTLSGSATTSSPFGIVSGGSYSLGAGGSQTVTVRFSPSSAGSFNKNLTFTGGGGAVVSLSGVGLLVPQLKFSATNYKVSESSAVAKITVKRSGGTASSVTVDYATSDGTAVAGADYTMTAGTLTFAAGQTSATFNIPIINDTLDELNETINLTLSNPTGGAVLASPSTAAVTITDNDTAGQLRLSASKYSVNENAGTATVTVTRSRGAASGVSVDYTTGDGTAQAGLDYVAGSGTLTFAAAQTSQTFIIPITNDTLAEGNETVNLTLTNPTGGASLGSPNTALLTIVDDEVPLQFKASSYTVSEASRTATITVVRSGPTSPVVTVDYATSDGTASAGSDYTATSGTLTFTSGQTSKTFTIAIINDTLNESTETVNLSLSNPTGGALLGPQNTAVLTIADNDLGGALRFSSATYKISETGPVAKITVQRSGGTASGVAVDYSTSDGTATAGSDYSATSGTLTFAAGQTSATFTIPIINDTMNESDETVNVTLSNPGGGAVLGAPSTAILTIADND